MLKVCGITFDHTVNYGTMLQTYALRTAIVNSEISNCDGCDYQLIPIWTLREFPDQLTLKRLLILPFYKLHRLSFISFEKKYIHFVPIRRLNELSGLNQKMDVFICGSDVIWNPDFNHHIKAFYLDFAEKYKFSYAASFGKAEIDTKTFEKIKAPLLSLNAISTREKTGEEIIRKYTGQTVKVVADPVLLLERDEWESILPASRNNQPYIFVYLTHLSGKIREFIEEITRMTGLKTVYAVWSPKPVLAYKKLLVQTPEKWLQQLHDAEYVITNSFHATAFSVLFHKKFFTVVNGDKAKGINIRMNDFLHAVGLEDRIFSSVPDQIDLSEIDYQNADEKIAQMRTESLAYLRENLEKANRIKKENENNL